MSKTPMFSSLLSLAFGLIFRYSILSWWLYIVWVSGGWGHSILLYVDIALSYTVFWKDHSPARIVLSPHVGFLKQLSLWSKGLKNIYKAMWQLKTDIMCFTYSLQNYLFGSSTEIWKMWVEKSVTSKLTLNIISKNRTVGSKSFNRMSI